MTQETNEPSGASGGSDSHVPAWADDLGREIACYLWGISALRHGLTLPGDFIPCVSAALRAGFSSGQIRLPASTPQVEAEHAGSAAAQPSAASAGYGLGSIRRREMDTPIRNRNGQVVGVIAHTGGPYKPGDQPPFGYCDWMEWAEVQHKAGLRQRLCVKCDKYRYPQEIERGGRSPVCKECSEG